jgi:aminoglycoside phosphotransferase (APT) family kinase protein
VTSEPPLPTATGARGEVLARWLRDRLDLVSVGGARDVDVTFSETRVGGQSNETVLFRASWADAEGHREANLVLRLQPSNATQIFPHPDAVREARVLDALGRWSTVPVPRVWWSEPDPSLLGVPFFVMSEVAGRVPLARPSVHTSGWLTTLDPEERARVSETGIETLAAIQRIDWRRSLSFLVDPLGDAPGVAGELARLERYHRWVVGSRPSPTTDAALVWLRSRVDSVSERAGDPVLVWGDARIGNVIYDHQPGTGVALAAVIDWELASIGPAGVDLGHWLFMDAFHAEAAGIARLDGYPSAEEVVAHHERAAGRRVADLDWFEVRSAVFMATTIIRQCDLRIARGELRADTDMGLGNLCTRYIARRLELPVPELSADWIAHRGGPAPQDGH